MVKIITIDKEEVRWILTQAEIDEKNDKIDKEMKRLHTKRVQDEKDAKG